MVYRQRDRLLSTSCSLQLKLSYSILHCDGLLERKKKRKKKKKRDGLRAIAVVLVRILTLLYAIAIVVYSLCMSLCNNCISASM